MSRDGFTWSDLAYSFPRKTLDRHLKALIREGFVEKVLELRLKGVRGRQSTRYRIPSKYWRSWGCLYVTYPAKFAGKVWFPGTIIEREGRSHVRLTGKRLKEYKEHLAWLKQHEPQEYEKFFKSEREKKRKRRYARYTQRDDKISKEVNLHPPPRLTVGDRRGYREKAFRRFLEKHYPNGKLPRNLLEQFDQYYKNEFWKEESKSS